MIFLLSSMTFDIEPGEAGLIQKLHVDKLIHVSLFGGLAWLILRALRRGHQVGVGLAVCIAMAATSLYGASDEWHQNYVPGRYPSAIDWVADTCGAVIAGIVYWRYESRKG